MEEVWDSHPARQKAELEAALATKLGILEDPKHIARLEAAFATKLGILEDPKYVARLEAALAAKPGIREDPKYVARVEAILATRLGILEDPKYVARLEAALATKTGGKKTEEGDAGPDNVEPALIPGSRRIGTEGPASAPSRTRGPGFCPRGPRWASGTQAPCPVASSRLLGEYKEQPANRRRNLLRKLPDHQVQCQIMKRLQ